MKIKKHIETQISKEFYRQFFAKKMRKSLMKMPIDQRYEVIRSTYEQLDKDVNRTMKILYVSKNA